MSMKKKWSFRSKISLESKTPTVAATSNDVSEQTGKDGISIENNVQPSETQNSDDSIVTQSDKKSLNGDLVKNPNSVEKNGKSVVYRNCSEMENSDDSIPSIAIPDGLAMDPLSPTALAISTEFMERIGSGLSLLRDHGKKVQKYVWKNRKFDVLRKSWKSVVNVVLVEAKDLPDGPAVGPNSIYCKFKLGTDTYKSKQVAKPKAMWCERFNMYLYDDNNLEITVWHKGKQKNFMGRCVLDLSALEKEKTHEFWQELECGYGSVHLLVTLNNTIRLAEAAAQNMVPANETKTESPEDNKFNWYRVDNDWSEIGQLTVTVHGARGLSAVGFSGKADAYCVLELDNSRVQTHIVRYTSEPVWDKTFTFIVSDITSTLDITVYDESILNSKDTLGKVSIPLLRIKNDEKKWYALKDRSKKYSAKGNCPRILLEMSIVWNPIKASLRVFSPKETKYMQKPPKFDIPLIYNNLVFIKDLFHGLYLGNEHYKYLFEWENRQRSAAALTCWLIFWYFFQFWMTPLLLLLPFLIFWVGLGSNYSNSTILIQPDDEYCEDEADLQKDEKTIKTRLYGLQDLTLTIKNSIDYLIATIERIQNLVFFAVPYLSYLAMMGLVIFTIYLYFFPVNYLFMALGIYKFSRKFFNPERIPNNDLLDFLSRVPDNEILKEWRELKVPEPNLNRSNSTKYRSL